MSRQVKKVNISGKEDKSNKVSSWSNTTTDIHYPSEKLVKDSLDGKANSTHNHTKSQITDFPTTMTPSSHTHGNLQNNGQVGSTAQANKNVVTDSSGKITTEDKPTIPSASSTTPSADTTSGSVGTGTTWARSNHTHPKSSLYAESSHNHTKSQITDFPTIPSKTSDLTNDSGFLTSHQSLSGYLQTSDVKDNLTSTDTDKPLSAKQGKELKSLIDNKEDKIYRIVGTGTQIGTLFPNRVELQGTFPFDSVNGKIIVYVVPDISSLSEDLLLDLQGTYPSGSTTKFNIRKSNDAPISIGEIQTGDELLLFYDNSRWRLIGNSSISGKIDSAGTGLSKSGTTLNHSNSITALTTASFKKVKYDSQGHITGTSDVSASDLPTHTHSQYLTSHQDITGKEDSSNKVSSWSSTTNNTRYPTEKLVKDSLDDKANSNHSHNLVDLNAQTSMGFKIFDYDDSNQEISFADSLVFDGSDITYNGYAIATLGDMPSVPSASSTVPSADTTNGSYGSGTSYARSNHTHPKSSLYAEASHTHSQYLSSLPSHNHDDRYYTESEVDTALNGKANSSHTHTKSEITDFPSIPSKTSDLTNDGDGTNVFVKDNDSRLSNARTPLAHTHLSSDVTDLIDVIYPVGSIYMSVNNVSPSTLFGGTWEQIQDTFLLASGTTYTTGDTGGSADATLVSHQHGTSTTGEYFVTSENSDSNNTRVSYNASGNRYVDGMTSGPEPFHHRVGTNYVGVSATGKNMPPYLVVNVWKRTA